MPLLGLVHIFSKANFVPTLSQISLLVVPITHMFSYLLGVLLFLYQFADMIRIEVALREEQEEIQADIKRIANEVELLSNSILGHVSRNTVCMETSVISKK